MYTHREEKKRVDVVDLDPYGTAAPFIDAALQCIKDGGEQRPSHYLPYLPTLYKDYYVSPARTFLF
jgi:hypothetical protein